MKRQRWTGIYLAGMVLVCACSREGPTTSREVPAESIIDLARATTLSGQVVTTIRSFAGDNILGTVIASEAHRFSGVVSRSGLTVAEVESSARSVRLTVAGVGSIASAAYSTPALNRSTFNGSEQRSIARTLAEDGRTALATYRRGGTMLATVATERTPVRGGWLITRRTYTTYRDGRPLHSVEEVLSDWVVTEGSGGLLPSLGPAMWSSSTVPVGEAAAEGGGDCQAEFDAMFDALDLYWAASVSMAGCLGGPAACFTVTVGLFMAARNVDGKEARLDRCLAQ